MYFQSKTTSSLLITVFLLSACTLADVDVTVVSERTSLENQVLGSYNSLSSEVLLVASVRGVDPHGRVSSAPAHSGEQQDAVEAIQILSFHADDVDAFKQLQWVGENNQGLLESFGLQKESSEQQEIPPELTEFASRYQIAEFEKVVSEVNGARQVVMQRVVERNENLAKDDLPRVQTIFAKIQADKSLPGDKIQNEDGSWMVKK
ncbi:MAG: YdbL family protein [Desulfobulbaceae bacterium]|nr:YdbL family protein [Desulfobulbaceae bacterium]